MNKTWYWRAKLIFLEKTGSYLEKQSPDLTPTTLFYSLQASCPDCVFYAWWDPEKILNLPKVEFRFGNPLHNLYQELKNHSIARTADCSIIAFLTTCQEEAKEGVLIIQSSRTLLGRKTTICWSSHHWKGNTKPLYFFFKIPASQIIKDLIQGKTIQLIHYMSQEPLTFAMVDN